MNLKFDIILQNNASKEVFLIKKQENSSEKVDYLLFEDIDLPAGMKPGEYTYAVICNIRSDVYYDFQNDLLETVVKTEEGDVKLKLLNPFLGLLTIKGEGSKLMFYEQREETEYYSQNLTIYYYN